MRLVDDALVFACQAHYSQTRKYTGEPYIVHPIEVMMLVRNHGGDDDMQAAALLHDVIEDCEITYEVLRDRFNINVACMVRELSDLEEGNRATRKALSTARLARASADVQTIKLADLYSNTRTIIERDPAFAKVYLKEKMHLMQVLTKGNRALFTMVWDQIPVEYREDISLKDIFKNG